MIQNCDTCDYNCPNHEPEDVCDNWEHTIYSIDIPDEIIELILHEPSQKSLNQVLEEALDALKEDAYDDKDLF